MKPLLLAWALVGVLSACKPSSPVEPPRPKAEATQPACAASPGLRWSALRGACVRPDEVGLAFDPDPLPEHGPAQEAYLLLAPAVGEAVTGAEVFLPGQTQGIALQRVHTPEGDIRPTLLANRAERIEVFAYKDEHFLQAKGQRYRRASAEGDRLFTIR